MNRKSYETKRKNIVRPKVPEETLEMSSIQSFPPLPQPLRQDQQSPPAVPTGETGNKVDERKSMPNEDGMVGDAREKKLSENRFQNSTNATPGSSKFFDENYAQRRRSIPSTYAPRPAGRSNSFGGGEMNARGNLTDCDQSQSASAFRNIRSSRNVGENFELGYASKVNDYVRERALHLQNTERQQQFAFNNQHLINTQQFHGNASVERYQLQQQQQQPIPIMRTASLAVGDGRPMPQMRTAGLSDEAACIPLNGNSYLGSRDQMGNFSMQVDGYVQNSNVGVAPQTYAKETKSVGTQTDSKFYRTVHMKQWDYGCIGGNYEIWFFPNYMTYLDPLCVHFNGMRGFDSPNVQHNVPSSYTLMSNNGPGSVCQGYIDQHHHLRLLSDRSGNRFPQIQAPPINDGELVASTMMNVGGLQGLQEHANGTLQLYNLRN